MDADTQEETYVTNDALTDGQIEMAQTMVLDEHPIFTTGLEVAFPYLCCLLGPIKECSGMNDQEEDVKSRQLKAKLLDNLKHDKNASKEARKLAAMKKKAEEKRVQMLVDLKSKGAGGDPFDMLGFGLMAYKNTIWMLFQLFFVLSFLVYPIIQTYLAGAGIDKAHDGWAHYSLGNMGYSSVQCASAPFMMQNIVLQCPYGKIKKIVDNGSAVGINGPLTLENSLCRVKQENNNEQCSTLVKAQFKEDFTKNCKDKQHCSFRIINDDLESASDTYFTSLNKQGLTKDQKNCLKKTSQFFVQYTCEQDLEDQVAKFDKICMVTGIMIMVSFIYILILYFLEKTVKMDQKMFDVNTITASDFTVELDITRKMWDDYLNNHYNPIGSKEEEDSGQLHSPALYLKKLLSEEISEILTETLQLRKSMESKESQDPEAQQKKKKQDKKDKKKKRKPVEDDDGGFSRRDTVEVLDIQFAFNNYKLINILKLRGTAIANCVWADVQKYDDEISELIMDKDGTVDEANYEKLTTPVTAFITFNSDDGLNEALMYHRYEEIFSSQNEDNGFVVRKVLGQIPVFTQATEPTNIIWEHRHIKGVHYGARVTSAMIIAFIMLAFSFAIIVLFKQKQITLGTKYPSINCEDTFTGEMKKNLQELGGFEYFETKANPNAKMNGALMCFCQDEKTVLMEKDLQAYVQKGYKKDYKVKDLDNKSTSAPICKGYIEDTYKILVFNNSLKYMIIAINTVLRMIVISVISWVGCSTESTQMSYITDMVFLCQLFNTGFLLMLCNGNLSEQASLFFRNGTLSDFDSQWFIQMGETVVGSMVFNSIFPIVMEIGFWGMRMAFRKLDSIRAPEGKNTSCISLQQYVNLYSGSTYFMHFKYSGIQNIIFITMLFGVGCPILFPVAALSLYVIYSLETFMLYFGYRVPPAYDEYLNMCVLANLAKAPLFMLSFGYWMLSNKQLISNDDLMPVEKNGDPVITNHSWYLFPKDAAPPANFLLMFFFVYFFYLFFRGPFNAIIECCCPGQAIEDMDVDEDIDLYQNCLDKDDREWTVKEEDLLWKYGICTQKWDTLRRIKAGRMKNEKMHLQGIHSYDILRNPNYHQAFQYFASDLIDRTSYIVDGNDDEGDDCAQSDLVRMALNLAFISKEELMQTHFKFQAAQCIKMKNANQDSYQEVKLRFQTETD